MSRRLFASGLSAGDINGVRLMCPGLQPTLTEVRKDPIQEWRETRIVEQEDLNRLDLVRYAPVIFQEYVPGVDLRIMVIGDALFAAEIDARNTSYPFDMRMVVGEGVVAAVTLPKPVQAQLLALMRRLNLVYGAIDMRRTDAGDHVFLEVNPAGQWLFVEQRTGQPIAKALADKLCSMEAEYQPYQTV